MDDLQISDCAQGSDEWLALRGGIPTASQFHTVLARGKGGGDSITRRKYMYTLAGQIITGEFVTAWEGNEHTERGKLLEADAIAQYEFAHDIDTQTVGFLRRGRAGASPDRLVGDAGLVEVKTRLPHLQIELLLSGEVPTEHKAQIQGELWVSGREWCDFVSYWPKLALFHKRVYRDEMYICDLAKAVDVFNEELDALVQRLKAMT